MNIKKNKHSGSVFVVATPIGNLADVTFRAIDILTTVDIVFAEDTRITRRLFKKYNIDTRLKPHTDHNAPEVARLIVSLVEDGKSIGIVSDAGTPGISDPGGRLLNILKELDPTIPVVPIPGPSALSAFLSICALMPGSQVLFLGFLPQKKGRKTLFREINDSKDFVVFYESPHRAMKTLLALRESCPQKTVCIAREMTKIFEEYLTGTPAEILEYFTFHPDHLKGEFVFGVM